MILAKDEIVSYEFEKTVMVFRKLERSKVYEPLNASVRNITL